MVEIAVGIRSGIMCGVFVAKSHLAKKTAEASMLLDGIIFDNTLYHFISRKSINYHYLTTKKNLHSVKPKLMHLLKM